MLESILLFIKAHSIATAITTTVVVGTAIATPIVIDNYKLEKEVKENMYMLVSSNYQIENENQIGDIMENIQESNNEDINIDKPLTFKIVKITTSTPGGSMTTNMKGEDAYEMSSEGTEYKIVPSYDKEYSEWTKVDKEAYAKAVEEAGKMAEEEYNKSMTSEGQEIQNAINEIGKINASYSKNYIFNIGHSSGNGGMESTSENWQYNSYTRTYRGSIWLYNSLTEEIGRWNFSKSI